MLISVRFIRAAERESVRRGTVMRNVPTPATSAFARRRQRRDGKHRILSWNTLRVNMVLLHLLRVTDMYLCKRVGDGSFSLLIKINSFYSSASFHLRTSRDASLLPRGIYKKYVSVTLTCLLNVFLHHLGRLFWYQRFSDFMQNAALKPTLFK